MQQHTLYGFLKQIYLVFNMLSKRVEDLVTKIISYGVLTSRALLGFILFPRLMNLHGVTNLHHNRSGAQRSRHAPRALSTNMTINYTVLKVNF